MNTFDMNVVRNKVKELMTEYNETQVALADSINMSQPNLSTRLTKDSSNYFTLEQLFNIAEHYNVSVDYLLGRHSHKKMHLENNARNLCELITRLLEQNIIQLNQITVKHRKLQDNITDDELAMFALHDTALDYIHWEQNYKTFYFPNYKDDRLGKKQKNHITVCESDTYDPMSETINDYIDKYLNILELYREGHIGDFEYDTIITSYLNELN